MSSFPDQSSSRQGRSKTRRRPTRVARSAGKREMIETGVGTHRVDRVASKADESITAAVRLLSETAHDLRSPLASVSATMELMRDGQFGDVTPTQAECLQAALRQCQYIDQLVGDLLHADRLRNGMPRVQRLPVKRRRIEQGVTEATAAFLATKRIGLLWDGTSEHASDVFVDEAIVSRLLGNLIVNAYRASNEGATILVKAADEPDRGVAVWSVIDCGHGISAERLEHLARSNQGAMSQATMRPASENEGEGLGLMISRQLAALNFSDLIIRSRQGSGTDVLFETPLTSPASVATSFAKFRSTICGLKSRPQAAIDSTGMDNRESDQPHQADATSQPNESTWSEARLGLAGPGPRRMDRLAVGSVSVGAACSIAHADEFDQVLQHALGRFEMAYRTSRRSWVWVLDADDHTIMNRREQIDAFVRQSIDTVRVQWGEPAVVPVQHRTLQNLLIDRMTTRTLAGAVGHSGGVAAGVDQDAVRLGTQPIEASPVPASRLDDELRRLGGRMKRQSQRLQAQASSLRPKS